MNRILAAIVLIAIAGCSREDSTSARPASSGIQPARQASMRYGEPGQAQPFARSAERIAVHGSFASLPDRGELLSYTDPANLRQPDTKRDGAYTWHRVGLSEEHAFRAVVDGRLRVRTPSGELLDIVYDRHEEHPSGDWTWIGHLPGEPGTQTILTFGAKAVFGSIGQANKRSLRVTTRNDAAWLVETDPTKLIGIASAGAKPSKPDYLAVPKVRSRTEAASQSTSDSRSAATAAVSPAAVGTTIDIVIGYTQGFVNENGGTSAALTRLNYLVSVGNQGFVNSQVAANIRLVHSLQVSYADTSTNESALEQLTGYDASQQRVITPDPAFNALRAAREQYGADLVALVRGFRDPEQDGCGIAWLIGGSKSGVSPGDGQDYFGYSVVSDGDDLNEVDSKTYFCRDESLLHELAHNLGSQHDRESAEDGDGVLNDPQDYGVFDYSFGLKTSSSAGNFYTVMAYGDQGQIDYRVFSNPRITFCGGFACGTTTFEDNARSLGQIAPVVATFRASSIVGTGPDLFTIKKVGSSGRTELHVLAGAQGYTSFNLHAATALGVTGSDFSWIFLAGDHNRDGRADLYAIRKMAPSGRTEVHIMDGASGYRQFLLHAQTALGLTGSNHAWVFKLADYNRDGVLDLYAIRRTSGSGRTEVHVLNGATRFSTFLLHKATVLGVTGDAPDWKFVVADFNRDGIPDLWVIRRNTGSGYCELHILNGGTLFQSYLLHRVMPLVAPGDTNDWEFVPGRYDADPVVDLFAIKKQGSSGKTEVHVVNGAGGGFTSFLLHRATALGNTGQDGAWDFAISAN